MSARIVLIDDEPDLVLLLTHSLEEKGYEVHSAFTGREGLELVNRVHPHAVVCDLMMPGMSGLEVCRKLRADKATKDMPILVISALGSQSDKPEEFWAAGLKSDDFISKPFEASELVGRLEYVLRKAQYVSTRAAGRPSHEKITAPDGSVVQAVPLSEAAPKIVVRTFIEAWNTQDFQSEHQCMDPSLTGGLTVSEYIARRRDVYAGESGHLRKQVLVRAVNQRRSADEATLVCERKDTQGENSVTRTEEYVLKKTPEGWKITSVRPLA
jgi:CheY-like chemotaxis protein